MNYHKTLFLLVFALVYSTSFAQQIHNPTKKSSGEIVVPSPPPICKARSTDCRTFEEEHPILKTCSESFTSYDACKKCTDLNIQKLLAKEVEYPNAHLVPPPYEGTVFISYLINKKGEMHDIKIVRSINQNNHFEQAALKAMHSVAEKYEWIAGKQNGIAVDVRMFVPIKFKF